MGRARARAEQAIDVRPDEVYAVLADYRTHHPRIMPDPPFSDLVVESGGVGEGTVFHICARIAGRRRRLHMHVAEPDPGRVLTETDLDSGQVTRFEVTADGAGTLARMSSTWDSKPGLRGLADRLVVAPMMSRTFGRQLRQLDRYVHAVRAPDAGKATDH
jgi:Polyketide cyclase / dehydrase and lipid transport